MANALNTVSGLPRGAPLSDMLTEISRWMKESTDQTVPSLTADAVNDAIEDLWMVVVRTVMSELIGGPVNLSLVANTERTQVVSIADPVGAPTVNLPAGTGTQLFTAAIALVTESGTETNVSPLVQVTPNNHGVQIVAPAFVQGAFGYNVYVSSNVFGALDPANPLLRINATPLDFGVNYNFAFDGTGKVTPSLDTEALSPAPTFNSTGDNIYSIEHMEILTPDGSYAGWSQADLDSTLMRRAARNLPEVSPYGRFLFDYISGGTLEIRPPVGAALTPRYFYINKPRKLKFANAPVPLGHIPGSWPYIRFKAISLLKLTNEEYQASSMWAAKAQDEELKIMQSLQRKTIARNNRVTPFLRP